MNDIYIQKSMIERLNNYELLIFATESFTQLIYFLETERGYNNYKIKIGNFQYDDWEADIYCILNNNGISFKHIRNYDKKSWTHRTLTEQLIYAWGFKEIKFNINFEIINEFWKLLNKKDKEIYDELYDEVHCKFW